MKRVADIEMPEINHRIQILINDLAGGIVAEFVRMTGMSSHQVLNRIFNIDGRSGKYPNPSADILSAIKLSLPQVNYDWLLTGKGEKYLTGEGEMLKDRVEKKPEPAKTPTQLELDFSKIADACQKSANAADESARTARILAEDNSKILHQLVDSISRIEKKMDVKGAAEDAKGVAKTGGQE